MEKILELINGDDRERRLAFDLMANFTLGETFELMKRISPLSKPPRWDHPTGVLLDSRNWFIFRRFNLPEGFTEKTFGWATWDISTIRWIRQNWDRKPDRVKPFIAYTGAQWVSQNEYDNVIRFME